MGRERKALFANIACIVVVMAAALLVRLPAAFLMGATPDIREAYTSEQGLPYLVDMDSYYHVRIVENDLANGMMGDTRQDDGTPWDSQSFYPEGRSAQYQPGIVKLTEAVWGAGNALFGVDRYTVEYSLAALMAALAGVVAFLVGARAAGRVGGLVAGVLVSCAPAFVLRTTFGRYDTDMFVVLMDVLLVLMLVECFRARTRAGRIGFAAGFGAATMLYAVCWAPQYAMLFAAVFLVGGLLFVCALFFAPKPPASQRNRIMRFVLCPELRAWGLCLGLAALAILVLNGPGFFAGLVSTLLWTAAPTASDVLPNMFVSVAELRVAAFAPENVFQWFAGYVPGSQMTALNGVGGFVPFALALAALAWLAFRGVKPASAGAFPLGRRASIMYFCILGLFLVGGLYAIGRGMRFIEHLSIPVGLLAGMFAGWLAGYIGGEQWKARAVAPAFVVVLCLAATLPALVGSAQLSAVSRPSASDASAEAMAWVRDNARADDAVIASWWDDGYFYEAASGHPCLWDGGSMNGIRSILLGKALTCDDAGLSRSILAMLVHSGNRAASYLMEHVDAQMAFEAIWEALPQDRAAATETLAARCGLDEHEAAEAEALLHPAAPKETYLVITGRMMQRYGWIEYFADWDFTGQAAAPAATSYRRLPDGRSIYDADDEEAAARLEERSHQLMWRLFVDGADIPGFAPVFDRDDGVDRVCVWRVG